MTREEAIANLERMIALFYEASIQNRMIDYSEILNTLEFAAVALRPITREQVENVWKGKWEPGNPICPICGKDKFDGLDADIWADWMPNFCPHCGAPMTDKAVEMVMERMEALRNES